MPQPESPGSFKPLTEMAKMARRMKPRVTLLRPAALLAVEATPEQGNQAGTDNTTGAIMWAAGGTGE
jgi:hypothetical protein